MSNRQLPNTREDALLVIALNADGTAIAGGGGGGGSASDTNQLLQIVEAQTTNTRTGALTETAPGTDTASSGLNGRLQRIAQRITSLIALLPTALGTGGGIKVDGSGTILPVFSGGATPTRTNVASSASTGTLLALNNSRKTAAITNESTAILYVLYGNAASASSTNYTYMLPATVSGISSTLVVDDYTGIITGIWASANGFARITEVA